MVFSKPQILTLIMLLLSSSVRADEPQSDSLDYVSINVEVKGLEKASEEIVDTLHSLNRVLDDLNQAIKEVNQSPEKLSPEQIQELTKMVVAVDNMMGSAGEVAVTIENTFDEMRVPAYQFVEDSILQANDGLIQPVIDKVLDELAIWRNTLVGLLILVIVLLTYLLVTSRNLITLITQQYRLVHISKIPE